MNKIIYPNTISWSEWEQKCGPTLSSDYPEEARACLGFTDKVHGVDYRFPELNQSEQLTAIEDTKEYIKSFARVQACAQPLFSDMNMHEHIALDHMALSEAAAKLLEENENPFGNVVGELNIDVSKYQMKIMHLTGKVICSGLN